MNERDPFHAQLGDKFYSSKGTQFQLTQEGWKVASRKEAWKSDDTSPDVLFNVYEYGSDVVDITRHLILDYQAIERDPDNPATWNDGHWARVNIEWLERMYAGSPRLHTADGTLTNLILATIAAFRAADTAQWSEEPARDWRRAVHSLSRYFITIDDHVPLDVMIEIAANNLHGGCTVSFDGDCFEPPPWNAYISGWPFTRTGGGGDTPQQAIRRAMRAKLAHEAAERAKPRPPEGVEDVILDDEGTDA